MTITDMNSQAIPVLMSLLHNWIYYTVKLWHLRLRPLKQRWIFFNGGRGGGGSGSFALADNKENLTWMAIPQKFLFKYGNKKRN